MTETSGTLAIPRKSERAELADGAWRNASRLFTYAMRSVIDRNAPCSTVTLAVNNGRHNAGIISEPCHPHRRLWLMDNAAKDRCLSAEGWLAAAPDCEGSWRPSWKGLRSHHSSGGSVAPPPFGGATADGTSVDAPGTYVQQR
ncbi:MAG TPA: hypothetical protein VKV96_09230 [Roseiarcus sp.]|nr:hypothetical protein [Roseiarcus sp.]